MQSACKEKLGKIIQSLLTADKTAAILTHTGHAFKVNDNFTVLEDKTLTIAAQFPQSLKNTQQLFCRGKPKSNGSKIIKIKNMLIIRAWCTHFNYLVQIFIQVFLVILFHKMPFFSMSFQT